MVNVFAAFPVLFLNYLAEPPLRFLIPVSTFAFAFRVGSRIYSWPYLKNPWQTAWPNSIKCFSVRGRCLLSLVS
jgi:hypothetical protein